MTRPRRTAITLSVLLATVSLAACAEIGIEENTFQTSPLPAITDDRTAEVLAVADEVVNEANAARDPELLATVVADPLLGIDVARYALDATADPENTDPLPAVEHTDPTVFVPRFASYPQWFVTASAVQPDAPLRLEVLGRGTASARWITSLSTDLLADVEFPELALDDEGYVIARSPSELADLESPVEEVAAGHAARLSGGEAAAEETPSFVDDAWTVARQAIDAQRGAAVADAATVQIMYEVTAVLPQALETADGGTLVFYALTEDVVYQVQPTYFLQLDEATAALVGTAEITTSLTERWAAQLAVYLPPQSGATARVIGARVDRIGLIGS